MSQSNRLFSLNFNLLLFLQAIANISGPVIVLSGGIIGSNLAPNETLATLPVSLFIVGIAFSVAPAILLMQKIGRRNGFLVGQLIGVLGAGVAAYGLANGFFCVFSVSCFLLGTQSAFILQLRFAAAESVPPIYTNQAVSLLLFANVFAAMLGPELAKLSQTLFPDSNFSALFIAVAVVHLAGCLPLLFFSEQQKNTPQTHPTSSPIKKLMSDRKFLTALISSAVAFAMMSYLMTAMPVQMHIHSAISLGDTARAIQYHLLAMFLPSLITGRIIDKLGATRVLLLGTCLLLLSIIPAKYGQGLSHFSASLVLLGVGWNFNFVAATALIANNFEDQDKFKAQALNDAVIFTVQAFGSLSAGVVLHLFGWHILLVATLPILLGSLTNILWRQTSAPSPTKHRH